MSQFTEVQWESTLSRDYLPDDYASMHKMFLVINSRLHSHFKR